MPPQPSQQQVPPAIRLPVRARSERDEKRLSVHRVEEEGRREEGEGEHCVSRYLVPPVLLGYPVHKIQGAKGGYEGDEYTPEGSRAAQSRPETYEHREEGEEGRSLGVVV